MSYFLRHKKTKYKINIYLYCEVYKFKKIIYINIIIYILLCGLLVWLFLFVVFYRYTMYQCTRSPVYKCTSEPGYQCTRVPEHQCTIVPVYQCTSVPEYQCTSLPVTSTCTLVNSLPSCFMHCKLYYLAYSIVMYV